jgi:hypothetical protein
MIFTRQLIPTRPTGETGEMEKAAGHPVDRAARLSGLVYFTTWEGEGSRASRDNSRGLAAGTATRGVVPDRLRALVSYPDQRA